MKQEELPQADMLADDIFGNQNEWYCKESVLALITTTAQRVREETVDQCVKIVNEKVKWANGADPDEVYEAMWGIANHLEVCEACGEKHIIHPK